MKIRSIATAAAILASTLAASAQAQSSASLYGLLDLGLVSAKAPGATTATNKLTSGDMTTSFWGIKAKEDLGGGMSAEAILEGFIVATSGSAGRFSGDPLFSRTASVGLNTGAGNLAFGRVTTSLFINTLIFNPLVDAFGYSPAIRQTFISGTVSGDTGWNESVKYSSPNFNGASFTAHQAIKGTSAGDNTGASALYFNGAFSAGVAYQSVRKYAVTNTDLKQATDTTQVGVAYDLGAAKLFAQYSDVKQPLLKISYKITGFGVSIPMGTGSIVAHTSQLAPSNAANSTTTTAGYIYPLSKRTNLYAMIMNERVPAKSDGNTYGVGLRHGF